MLIEQTLTQLHELRLFGMAEALEEQRAVPDVEALSFEDRFALLLDREANHLSFPTSMIQVFPPR
jgi:hypothetical protein